MNAREERETPLIRLRDVRKVYRSGRIEVEALRGIDLDVRRREFAAVVGPSGSGKSTLMNLLGCLDTPTAGSYELSGENVAGLDRRRLARIRNRRIGFVFQSFNLLPAITAFENVEMPLLFSGTGRTARRRRVEQLLERVGLADRGHHRPTELSGGQMQRVAIARALAMDPDLLLADEPTGNLDTRSGSDIMGLFEELWEQGATIVVVTHDPALARRCRRVIEMRDGRIIADRAPAAA
ncbi:MAG: ABC transporter ATP-binding protein [Acidobacteria bacterium]|nr:MAG: ABC transporter ATP-binding protein [Acidobacteriota bacterium]